MLRTYYPALVIGLLACGRSSQPAVSGGTEHVPTPGAPHAPADPPAAPAPVRTITLAEAGIDGIDTSADPCTDFYQYACGAYAGQPVPAGATRWDRSDDLRAHVGERIRRAATNTGAHAQAITGLHKGCADSAARASAGLDALKPLRDVIADIKNPATLSTALGTLHAHGVWAALSLVAAPDFRAGGKTILHVDSGGLTLGDRAYYLDAKEPLDGTAYADLRRDYERAIADLFEAAGDKNGRNAARDVLAVETQLARAARSRYERRNPAMLYDRIDRKGLEEIASQLDWKAYFEALGGEVSAISTTSRAYLDRVGVLAKSLRASQWQSYLEWRVLYTFANDATTELATARRAVDALVPGAPPAPDCASATATALPKEVASWIAAEGVRDRAVLITGAMIEALARGVGESSWMAEPTRARAVTKVRALRSTTAGEAPGQAPRVTRDHLRNALAAREARTVHALEAARTGADWWAEQAHVGITYSWPGNLLRVPAGVLAAPVVSADRPIALDVGALAMLAGHELAHAVDDRGAAWTERGDLGNWWQAADDAAFAKTSACYLDRAAKARLDGRAILGEERADAVGLAIGLRALASTRAAAPESVRIEGLSAEQLYFLGAATALCAREPGVASGHRAPARHRVNATMANSAEFAAAWSCKPGAAMRAAKPCTAL